MTTETWDDYLCTERFMNGFLESVALDTAFKAGLIDQLLGGPVEVPGPTDAAGWFLWKMLEQNHVVQIDTATANMTEAFRQTIPFRELLEWKLHFNLLLAKDTISSPGLVFQYNSDDSYEPEYLRYFRYNHTESRRPAERELLLEWVRYMTILTRFESAAVIANFDFDCFEHMMDVGGNSGEFAFQVASACPTLLFTVFDLPGVVSVGTEWNHDRPGADRVEFIGGDAFRTPLPGAHDLISFKGVLHDWPDDEALRLLDTAWTALEPGGTMLIAERRRSNLDDYCPIPISQLTMLIWSRIFRDPSFYASALEDRGGTDIVVRNLDLDLPWMIISARKPA